MPVVRSHISSLRGVKLIVMGFVKTAQVVGDVVKEPGAGLGEMEIT